MGEAVSINVGSNSQHVNGRGVVDPFDFSFDYLPIPETEQVMSEVPTYADLKLRNTGLKAPWHPVHLDPEFETYTYGHVRRGYGDIKALLGLDRGDYLFFHATLSHPGDPSLWLTAVIGYFVVEDVFDCRGLSEDGIRKQYGDRFNLNAHLRRADPSVDILISGSDGSRLLDRAIPLSSFSLPRRLNERFRGVITTLTGKDLRNGSSWFRWTLKVEDPEKLLEAGDALRRSWLHLYTMTSDSGFAPHVGDGWISLACCAAPTREHTRVGSFVLGVSGKTMRGVPFHTPIFLMQVDEKLTFDEYFNDERFRGRADNIYFKGEDGDYVQDKDRRHLKDKRYRRMHSDENDAEKSRHVLLSRHFYYFGDCWRRGDSRLTEEMEKLCERVGFKYTVGGHYKKVRMDNRFVQRFLRYIIRNYRVGKNGEPNHLPDSSEDSTRCGGHYHCSPDA
jgi:hypothetical protein